MEIDSKIQRMVDQRSHQSSQKWLWLRPNLETIHHGNRIVFTQDTHFRASTSQPQPGP